MKVFPFILFLLFYMLKKALFILVVFFGFMAPVCAKEINLTEDWDMEGTPYEITEDLTINGNGHTITGYFTLPEFPKNGIKLVIKDAIIDGNVPEDSYIEWDMSEGNFSLGWDSDTDVYATAEDKGWDTITAILYDADGNELARDSVELYSKSGFFDKIGGFFRSLFGMTKTYYN